MKRAFIIIVVALIMVAFFLSPLVITKSQQIAIPTDQIAIISPYYGFQTTGNVTEKEIMSNLGNSQEIDLQSFSSKPNIILAAMVLENLPKGIQRLTLIEKDSSGIWYKTLRPIGYFQTVSDVEIQGTKVIYSVTGNIGTTLFWALMSLAIGVILILLFSILNADIYKKPIATAD